MDMPGEGTGHIPCVALWKTGGSVITVGSPQGGSWEYPVPPGMLEPDSAWLRGTPWGVCPGGRWEEQPGGFEGPHRVAMPPKWTIPVIAAAQDLARG